MCHCPRRRSIWCDEGQRASMKVTELACSDPGRSQPYGTCDRLPRFRSGCKKRKGRNRFVRPKSKEETPEKAHLHIASYASK